MKTGYSAVVYVMDAGDGLLKVGHSADALSRSRELYGEISRVLYQSSPSLVAYRVECAAHALLADKRVRGELFSAGLQECIDAISQAEMATDGFAPVFKPCALKSQLTVKMGAAILQQLRTWIAAQPAPPSLSAVVEAALREFLRRNRGK